MNRLLLLIIFATSAISQKSFGQKNYLGYFDLVNRAEEQFVVNSNKTKSYALYDSAFSEYDKPFVKDFFIASQIAYYNGDTSRFLNYIKKSFDTGMTFQCLHAPRLFDSLFANKSLLATLDSIYERREKLSVDTVTRDSVYMRFYKMETAKKNMGRDSALIAQYHLMEKSNTDYYASFFKKGAFPSEQLMGLYTEDGFDLFLKKYNLAPLESPLKNIPANAPLTFKRIPDDYALWNEAAFASFLHYPCAFSKYKKEFWQAVENGYVHPKDYAMLEEWLTRSFNVPSYLHDCLEEKQSCYYNITSNLLVTRKNLIKQVEVNRANKHLQKYSVDLLKKKMQSEKGFGFFFGFFDYR